MGGKPKKYSRIDNEYKLQINKFKKVYDTRSSTDPKPRSGHRIVCTNLALFSIGGYNPNDGFITNRDTLFHEVWRFDFSKNCWKKLNAQNLPRELASCATVLSGNLMFLYGGTATPFGQRINEDVYVCNLKSSENDLVFSPIIINGQKPPKQYGQSIALDGNYLYTVGGTQGLLYTIDVFRLDLETRMWQNLCDGTKDISPPPRYRHEMVHYKDRLYILGGGTSTSTFTLSNIPAFNLKESKWETFRTKGDELLMDRYPASRRCHACVQDPHNPAVVFINGGFNDSQAFNDTWRLDLNLLTWTCLQTATLPHRTYFHSAAATPDGRMTIFGGITDKQHPRERTADVFMAWITIPKLRDACCEAISFYVRSGKIKLPENLNELGLPEEYVSRWKTYNN